MDKTAFITHTTDRGGASESFLTTMRALSSKITYSDHLLIYPATNKLDAYVCLKQEMPRFQWRLPFAWIFRGAEPGIHRKVYRMVMEGFAMFAFLFKYNKILEREQVRTIYLNSIVLWCLLPVLPQYLNLVIHIRESFDDSLEARLAIWTIRHYADTIIAIDANVAKPFADLTWKVKIIQNPIDMTRARGLVNKKDILRSRVDIPKNNFVVALLAPVGQMKGHPFLLEVLAKIKADDITFVLAGLPDKHNILVEKLKAYQNVKYLGEVADVSNIYAMSDIVIRCEDYLPLGRTVWEGVYAGLPVLLPIRSKDDSSIILDYLGQYIFTYTATNVDSFIYWLTKLQHWDFDKYPVSSNVEESAKMFMDVIS